MTGSSLKLKIGTPVEAIDGPLGHIYQVILSPVQRRVVGLVVRSGLLLHRDLIVPTELIVDATDERVVLRAGRDDIERQPAFDPAHYLPLAAEEQTDKVGVALASIYGGAGGADDRALVATYQREEARVGQSGTLAGYTVAIQRGQTVWALDGRAGYVDLVLLDANDQVHHFVIHRGRLLGYDVLVPVDWISAIDKHGVWLVMARTALDRLPPYRPDSAIAADVAELLWQDEVIQPVDIENINIAVRDGVVILSGYTITLLNKSRAARIARQAPGVLDVENRIVTDNEVEVAVGQALAHDMRTRGQPISIYVKYGVVTLSGKIHSVTVRAAAEEVAASVPQTRGIINDIQTPGVVVDPAQQRVLQPRLGQSVYAKDMEIGRVEAVIVNPRHRRVTGIVVRGKFPDPPRPGAHTLANDKTQTERWIVIPIAVVQSVTIDGVLLTISAAAVSQYPDFDPNEFGAPAADWQPPYPYTHADVLLDATGIAAEVTAKQETGD